MWCRVWLSFDERFDADYIVPYGELHLDFELLLSIPSFWEGNAEVHHYRSQYKVEQTLRTQGE